MKTLILSALRCALNIKTKILILLLALTCSARATFIETGQITFTGDFTLNHLYDFNNQSAQPFGWFRTQTASQVTGIFSPFVQNGNILSGSTALWTLPSGAPVWTIGGFTLTTTFELIGNGPDSGRFSFGVLDMTGNGYKQRNDYVHWEFLAPPYDISHFDHDITGPISLLINVRLNVPDGGSTVSLLGFGLLGLAVCWRKLSS
jgi:hypothetical protein